MQQQARVLADRAAELRHVARGGVGIVRDIIDVARQRIERQHAARHHVQDERPQQSRDKRMTGRRMAEPRQSVHMTRARAKTSGCETAGDLVQPLTGKPRPPTPLDGTPLDIDDPHDRRGHLHEERVGRCRGTEAAHATAIRRRVIHLHTGHTKKFEPVAEHHVVMADTRASYGCSKSGNSTWRTNAITFPQR